MNKLRFLFLLTVIPVLALSLAGNALADTSSNLIHDAEHNILKSQHGERWAKEDAKIDAKLAEIREKNGGKPPNFV